MHIPVFLCGLICGWQYGLAVGFMLPLMRSMLFFMPAIFPDAAAMAFELAAYGFFCGFLYEKSPWHCIISLYRCLLSSMLFGRIVWGGAMLIFLGAGSEGFTAGAFFAGAFFNAIPGIILQLAIIPSIMLALDKTHMVPFRKKLRIKKNCKNRVLRHNLSLFTKNLLKIFQIGYITLYYWQKCLAEFCVLS